MIAHLEGIALTGDIVDVSGVGYAVVCPAPLAVGAPVRLWIHHHHSDTGDTLYGFPTTDARDMFTALLRCPGVGGRTACDIVASAPLPVVVAKLRAGDTTWLCTVKGIGPAKAKKMLASLHVPAHLAGDAGDGDGANTFTDAASAYDDLTLAAADLAGVAAAQAAEVLAGLRAAGVTDEPALLRAALRTLGTSR